MDLVSLPDQVLFDLEAYADLLRRVVDPAVYSYAPIAFRKLPKDKRLEAERVCRAEEALKRKLGLEGQYGYGRWKLAIDSYASAPITGYDELSYWSAFPLRSENREYLEYLAQQALPRVFPQKKFVVRNMMVPCNGDCSWDCR